MPYKSFVALECASLFLALPLLLGEGVLPWQPQATLLTVAGVCAAWLLRRGRFQWRGKANGDGLSAERSELHRIGRRFGIAFVGAVGLVVITDPARLFDLPAAHPHFWLTLLLTYPLSVLPQELVFRAYFFTRYQPLFPQPSLMIMASATTFGWVHLIYGNWIAIVLSFVGGIFFAGTYARTGSLRLVFFEHTLYGSLLFTIGLGEFFLLDGVGWPER